LLLYTRSWENAVEVTVIDVLLPGVLLIGVATLTVVLWRLRRSEVLGQDRYELLRNQHERLELLREERRMLMEELA
jgi:hypothetical protein